MSPPISIVGQKCRDLRVFPTVKQGNVEKVLQTILANPDTPEQTWEKSAPNTFQKGASLKHLTNLTLPEMT